MNKSEIFCTRLKIDKEISIIFSLQTHNEYGFNPTKSLSIYPPNQLHI